MSLVYHGTDSVDSTTEALPGMTRYDEVTKAKKLFLTRYFSEIRRLRLETVKFTKQHYHWYCDVSIWSRVQVVEDCSIPCIRLHKYAVYTVYYMQLKCKVHEGSCSVQLSSVPAEVPDDYSTPS